MQYRTLGRTGVVVSTYALGTMTGTPSPPLEETLRFLDDAVSRGKITYYGFSNFLGWQLTKAVHVARAEGWHPPVSLQRQYSLLVRDIESEIVPGCGGHRRGARSKPYPGGFGLAGNKAGGHVGDPGRPDHRTAEGGR